MHANIQIMWVGNEEESNEWDSYNEVGPLHPCSFYHWMNIIVKYKHTLVYITVIITQNIHMFVEGSTYAIGSYTHF